MTAPQHEYGQPVFYLIVIFVLLVVVFGIMGWRMLGGKNWRS